MGMLIARNVESLLKQALQPAYTTESQVVAVTIIQLSGTPLCTVTNDQTSHSIAKINMFALFACKDGITEEFQQYQIEDDENVYAAKVPGTQYSVVIVTEKNYPQGLVRIRLSRLSEELTELSKFEEDEDY
jgi:hypothetical protein